jgi:ketosteroid isomerase-like protein
MAQTAVDTGIRAVLSTYLSAWNEPDPAERARLLDSSVADDVVFIDPMAHVEGRDAVAAHITATRETFPGILVEAVGDVDAHHGVLRHAWRVSGPDGVVLRGLDVDEVGEDGRLRRILGFFDRA